ncbi:MAG: photosynthetic reaction center subunit H [Pseudomonadota bacterium]
MTNNIVGSIDLVEFIFTLFWLFFAVLVLYLHRESKREGYPLEAPHRMGDVVVRGFPSEPKKKTFKTRFHGEISVPRKDPEHELAARYVGDFPGAPIEPTGDPLVDGIGPAAWSDRADTPDLTLHGKPRIVPMRNHAEFGIDERDADPRGMKVIAADGESVGTVTDAWIDIPEPGIVYIEIALDASIGSGQVLMPFAFVDKIDKAGGALHSNALLSDQYGRAPRIKDPDTITLLEEEKVMGYFGGGKLLAEPSRSEPLI